MMSIDHVLKDRLIFEEALQAGWREYKYYGRPGWSYPVFDYKNGEIIGTRWKAAPGRAGMKYGWIPEKPDNQAVDWYILPETRQAIAAADGICYLANGEPALLAYHAAGVHNVISTTLSEAAVPADALELLRHFEVARLVYPIDNDPPDKKGKRAGFQSAINWRDALRDSGIDYEAYHWASFAPDKADANDMWIITKGEQAAFNEIIRDLIPVDLPAPVQQEKREFDDADYEKTPTGLIDAIINAAENKGYKGRKDWLNGPCLFPENHVHDDKNASAGIAKKTGVLNCFVAGCGEHGHREVAERLGIDWRQYYSKPKKKAVENTDLHNKIQRHISEWAFPVRLPEFAADKRVNMRYISDIDLAELGRSSAIRSPLATGKTALISKIIRFFDKILPGGARVLVVTHLQALAGNIAERLSSELDYQVDCYSSIPAMYRGGCSRLVCSYDSLHTVGDEFDFVIIDEHEQFHRHISAGTMRGGAAQRAYEKLKALIEKANRVIALDAHMSNTSLEFIRSIRGDVTAIENEYRHPWGDMLIQEHESAMLVDAFAAAAGDSAGIVLVANTRAKTEIYQQLAIERFGKDAVVLINGNTSSSSDIQAFIRKLTSKQNQDKRLSDIFPGLKALIVSPSMGTGIDIQAHVAGVFGMFANQRWVNGYNIMQMMMRYRHAEQRQICVLGGGYRENPESTDFRIELQRHIQRAIGTAEAAKFEAYNIVPLPATQVGIAKLQTKLDADTAPHRNDLFSYIVAVAKDEGFNITYGDGENTLMKESLIEAAIARKESEKQTTLEADPVSPDEFEAMRQAGYLDSEAMAKARAGELRWRIEHAAGQEITDILYDMLHRGQQRSNFNRLVDMLDDVRQLQDRDRAEAASGVLLTKRRHYTRTRDLVDMGLQSVFGPDWINSNEWVSAEQISERTAPFFRSHLSQIQIYIDMRSDLSNDPVAVLRRLAKAVHMKLESKQIMQDGERFYVYRIDPEYRAEMLGYARVALKARIERIQQAKEDYSNHGNYIKAYRELSNKPPVSSKKPSEKHRAPETVPMFT